MSISMYHAKMPLHVLVSNIMAQLNAGNVIGPFHGIGEVISKN